jgi:hypothetical protein
MKTDPVVGETRVLCDITETKEEKNKKALHLSLSSFLSHFAQTQKMPGLPGAISRD